MIDHLKAIQQRLDAAKPSESTDILIGDATGHGPPYIVLWSGSGDRPGERSHAGARGEFTAQVGVTCTGANPEAALMLAAFAVSVLTPGLDPAELPGVPGRHVTLAHFDSRPVQVERSTTETATNTHRSFVVVLFDLNSQPTGA